MYRLIILLVTQMKKENELDNVELLFRLNSKGLTEEEKEIFKKELIEFIIKRKKEFKRDQ